MPKYSFTLIGICLILGITTLLYGYFYEPNTIKITRYTIKNSELSGLKIVFASDFHIATDEHNRLNNIITTINNLHPDITILGGDYTKGHNKKSSMPIKKIVSTLNTIESPLYAILGNHDTYYGKTDIIKAFNLAKIPVLENKNIRIRIKDKELTLAGVADDMTDTPDITKAFNNAIEPIIFITHSPDVFSNSPNKAVLTLAAHTHGGQIRLPLIGPLIIPSKYGRRYATGYFYENGKKMIVTQGLGTSLLPIRLNCPPEIVLITFN